MRLLLSVLWESKLLLVAQDQKLEIRNGSTVNVNPGDMVAAEDALAYFDPFSDPIIAEQDGKVRFEDIIIGTTLERGSERRYR